MSDQNTASEEQSSSILFSDLQLPEPIQSAITSIGYEKPSPIQAQAIPHLLEGRDILGIAQTGTGKTAAFALPLLAKIADEKSKSKILCYQDSNKEMSETNSNLEWYLVVLN